MADLNNFERVIKEDRAARESKQWRGTLLEYLEVVKADPIMTKLAHARIYDLIISSGLASAVGHRRSAHQAALQGRAA